MDGHTIAALEQAVEPYKRAGFIITSQSEGAITLVHPPENFSYLFFIFTLILFWPIAVIYLISINNQKGKIVCVRITSQGQIEVSGHTLAVIERERRRRRIFIFLSFSIIAAIFLLIMLRLYLSRMQ